MTMTQQVEQTNVHPPVTPEDDRFHERTDDPYWNESAIICFGIPERNLSGYLYVYHRPNMNHSAGGVALWNGWDGVGENIYDCLFHEWNQKMPLPEGADMFDCTLQNSMTWKPIELGKSYRITFDRRGLALDLVWTSFMPPHELKPRKEKPNEHNIGIQGWIDGPRARHFEHIGTLKGWLDYEGERIEVDTFALRDHSWGARTIKGAVRASWPWAAASESHNFQAYCVPDKGWEEDPIEGVVDSVVGGWYTKDGVQADLVSGTRRSERGPDGRPLVEHIDAVDSLGRRLQATGRTKNLLKWPCYVEWLDFWSLAEWEFDGVKAQGEAHCYSLFRHYHRMWRKTQPITI